MIYTHILSGSKRTGRYYVLSHTISRWTCELELSLVRLGQTCKEMHCEIDEILHAGRNFEIEVSSRLERRHAQDGRVDLNFSFLHRLRRVHLSFSMPTNTPLDHEIVARMEIILRTLRESIMLEVCTVKVGFVTNIYDEPPGIVEARKELDRLRRLATKEGVRDGKNAKNRELDFARRAVEYLKNALASSPK